MASAKRLFLALMLVTMAMAFAAPVGAGNTLISINSGDASATFTIRDEPALVINGFDLASNGVALPVTIDAVNISVVRPVPGQAATVVLYADENGGTPQDARIIARADVSIFNTGTVRIPLPVAATTNAPIVWAGLYLPVDFSFASDQSGSSVLTYWAWTPGGTFDLGNLASAAVFGPGDGSAPVSIAMGGKARISLELTQADGRTTGGSTIGGAPLGSQTVGDPSTSLAGLNNYANCSNIRFDPADVTVTAGGAFVLDCRQEVSGMQPGTIGNISQVPSAVPGFERRGVTYQISANGAYQATAGDSNLLRVPVTHCLAPNAGDLDRAVLASAYGVPARWYLLPTMRYGEFVCAEVDHIGALSYFVPRTGTEGYINADLLWSGSPFTNPSPDKLRCNDQVGIEWKVKNDGFEATPVGLVRLSNVAVRTGQVTLVKDMILPSIAPGQTIIVTTESFKVPNSFLDEANRLVFQIDPLNTVLEINESNNTVTYDYILKTGGPGC